MTHEDLARILTGGEFGYPEAEAYFRGKVPMPRKAFYALAEEYRGLAFTVSNYSRVEVLAAFKEALQQAIDEGTTLRDFRARMDSWLEDAGYRGTTPFMADNIFRTNVQTAYNVGHYKAMTSPEVLAARPYWQYDAVGDFKTRPSHLAMDGRVYAADDPIWDTWYPPNGYRCRCGVRSLSQRQLEAEGLRVETKAPGRAELPDGRVVGIQPDPHFNSNPAKVQWQPDLTGYPPELAAAYRAAQKAGR